MRGLTRLDKLLLALLLPIWVVGVALHIDRIASDLPLAWFPAYLAAGTRDEPPEVLSLWPDVPERAETLRPGDRLLEVGPGRSLLGASRMQVIRQSYLHAADETGARGERRRVVSFRVERDGATVGASLPLQLVPHPATQLVLSVGIGLSGILVLARGRGRRVTRAYALAAVAYALHFCSLYGGAPWQTTSGFALLIATAGLYPPLLLRAALLFPPSAAPRGRMALRWPWVLGLGAPAAGYWLLGSPRLGGGSFTPLATIFASTIAALIAILVRNYARADARGRRQMRWAFYGLVVGTLPPMVFAAIAGADPTWRPVYELSLSTQLVLPFCLFVALVHDRLFDIDRLISETAAIALLGIPPLVFLLTLGVALAERVSETTGLQQSTVVAGFVCALLGPLPFVSRRLAPVLHLRLHPERRRFDEDMRRLRRDLDDVAGSAELFTTLGKRLEEGIRLEALAIYVPVRDVVVAAFARGPLVAPAFARDGALLELLREAGGPVSRRQWRRWARRGALADAERAALEGISAEWLIPAVRAGEVDALLCIGPRTSGDLFTAWESAVLESVVERAAVQLDRFDQEDRVRRERHLIEELRRYVPAPVERALARGHAPEAGQVEVSIFFVDVRGSTAWAEARSDAEVFETMARFTRKAAAVVERHGGTVVEFAGDGFMAIFGAAGQARHKERSAIAAGREILAAARSGILPLEVLPERPIGVGIATGTAYVGEVRIGSHVLWTALGDVANLAARLESLTKAYETGMVIEERTYRGAGEDGGAFEPLGSVEIRGRTRPERLYALVPRVAREGP